MRLRWDPTCLADNDNGANLLLRVSLCDALTSLLHYKDPGFVQYRPGLIVIASETVWLHSKSSSVS